MYSSQTYEAPNTLDYVYICIYTHVNLTIHFEGSGFYGFFGDSLCGFAK